MITMKLWNGTEVPRVGVGCWAIGGAMYAGDTPLNYAGANDTTSKAGLNLAYDLGARVFDTAAGYGGGHSERLVGEVLGSRDDVTIVTKFGFTVDPDTRLAGAPAVTDREIRDSVDRSRRNLRRDRIDCLLFHLNDYPADAAVAVFDTLDALVAEGKVATYGWSTDFPDRLSAFVDRPNFVAVENDYNLFTPAVEVMAIAERKAIVSISRVPLAMGLLTGKFKAGEELAKSDIRSQPLDWMVFFKDGKPAPEFVEKLEALRELLTVGGRSLAQGALGWILAKSPVALPVPGFKTEAQIRDNLGAAEKGPLPADVMTEIESILRG